MQRHQSFLRFKKSVCVRKKKGEKRARACSIFEKRGGKKSDNIQSLLIYQFFKTLHCVCLCACLYMLYVLTCTRLHACSCCECAGVCVCVCMQEQGHTLGLAWQVFGAAFDIIEKIYSSRSPDDKRLAAEQKPFQTFYFTGSKLCFKLLAAGKGLVHIQCRVRRVEKYIYFTVKRAVIFEREESNGKGIKDNERKGEASRKLQKHWPTLLAQMLLHYHGNQLCFQIFNINIILLNLKNCGPLRLPLSPSLSFSPY